MPRYTIQVMDLDNPRAGATLAIWARDDGQAVELANEAIPEIVNAWRGRFKDPVYKVHNDVYPRSRRSVILEGKVRDR